jgi:hypothetical protein
MYRKIKIYVIHYSKLKDRYNFFLKIDEKKIEFEFITEKDVSQKLRFRRKKIQNFKNLSKRIRAIHLGHTSNILRSRILANYFLIILTVILRMEVYFFQTHGKIYNRLVKSITFSAKLCQVNLMHAKALTSSAGKDGFTIILEDDSIFDPNEFYRNTKAAIKFLKKNTDSVIFLTNPTAPIKETIEDFLYSKNGFIQIIPPMSKGAGAYILGNQVAAKLGEFILMAKLDLPIDLLFNYWAQENQIKVYWEKVPTVTEGSGKIYESSLR